MNCKRFERLSPPEREEFIGKLLHVVQSDDTAFLVAKAIIKAGEGEGLLDGVKVGQRVYEDNDLLTITG